MKNNILLFLLFLNFQGYSQQLIPYKCGNLWGLANRNAELIIPCQFDSVHTEDNAGEFYCVGKKTNDGLKFGIVNKQGKMILPFSFEEITYYSSHFYVVKNGLEGVYTSNGKELFECKYTQCNRLENSDIFELEFNDDKNLPKKIFQNIKGQVFHYDEMFWVRNHIIGRSGSSSIIFNQNAEKIAEIPYWIYRISLSPNLFLIERNDLIGLADTNGKILFEPQFDKPGFLEHSGGAVMILNEDYIHVRKKDTNIETNALIHRKTGTMDVPLVATWYGFFPFENHYVGVKLRGDSRWGLFHLGKQILPYEYEKIYYLKGDLFICKKDGRSFVWNPKTQEISQINNDFEVSKPSDVTFLYDLFSYLSEYFLFHVDNQTFLKNAQLQTILSGDLELQSFHDEMLELKKDGKYGIIYRSKIIVPFEYDSIFYRKKDVICLKKNNLWEIFQFKNDSLKLLADQIDSLQILTESGSFYRNVHFIVSQHKKFGFISHEGNFILPCNFNLDVSIYGVTKWISTNKKQPNYAFFTSNRTFISYQDLSECKVLFSLNSINSFDILNKFYSLEFQQITIESKNGKIGYKNKEKHWIIPAKYDSLDKIDDDSDLIIAKKGNKYGVIDYQNKIHLPFKYDKISQYTEGWSYDYSIPGVFWVERDGVEFFVTDQGVEMLQK